MDVATTYGAETDRAPSTTRAPRDRRRVMGLLATATALAFVCMLSLAVGTENVAPTTVWQALTDYTDTGNKLIVHDLRIPRALLGIVVGIALGLSGA